MANGREEPGSLGAPDATRACVARVARRCSSFCALRTRTAASLATLARTTARFAATMRACFAFAAAFAFERARAVAAACCWAARAAAAAARDEARLNDDPDGVDPELVVVEEETDGADPDDVDDVDPDDADDVDPDGVELEDEVAGVAGFGFGAGAVALGDASGAGSGATPVSARQTGARARAPTITARELRAVREARPADIPLTTTHSPSDPALTVTDIRRGRYPRFGDSGSGCLGHRRQRTPRKCDPTIGAPPDVLARDRRP